MALHRANTLLYSTLLLLYDFITTKQSICNTSPKDLLAWRNLCDSNDTDDNNTITNPYKSAWRSLEPLLGKYGIRLWNNGWGVQLKGNKEFPAIDNYSLLGPTRKETMANIDRFCVWNGLSHAASRRDGRDFILRIITAGGQGHDHLRIIQRLSSPPDIFQYKNHILPMVDQVVFEDITIGLFPRLNYNIQDVGFPDRQVSIEDILYVVLQALEGVIYIHSNRIAHRDLFASNLMIEWCPESIKEGRAVTQPRVYLIDFECAVEFPEDSLESERLCVGVPFPKEMYIRKLPEEVKDGVPYDPFCLDMWQFGFDLKPYFPVIIPEVRELWEDLNAPLAQDRPTALQAFQRLETYVASLPPSALHAPYMKSTHKVADH